MKTPRLAPALLLPLALSHALCTLAILCCFDPRITGGLRIGYSYLQRH